jgi:alpha-mannosidase
MNSCLSSKISWLTAVEFPTDFYNHSGLDLVFVFRVPFNAYNHAGYLS